MLALNCYIQDENESLYVEPTELLVEMRSPFGFIFQVDYTMHIYRALKQPDKFWSWNISYKTGANSVQVLASY